MSISKTNASEQTKTKVVACNSIIADWVREIAKGKIELYTIVPPDTDNHSFEPSARDAIKIAQADLIFEIGLGFEFWLDGIFNSSESQAQRIELSNYSKKIALSECASHHCSHHHSDFDPHVWLNPNNVILMVERIGEVLSKVDSPNKAFYMKNTAGYKKELSLLNKWILQKIEVLPLSKRKLVTNHDNFSYFAKEYGFDSVGNVLGSASTETGDPSASQFVKLLKLIKEKKVRAIFAENIQNTALVDKLAQEAHLPKPNVLYTEALSSSSGPASTYLEMMRYNVKTIVGSLSDD